MLVVALLELAGSLNDAAALLAAQLSSTAYEQRLLLAAGLPAIVKVTPDRAQALEVLAALRNAGHEAAAFDADAVVPSHAMVAVSRLGAGPEGLSASALGTEGPAEHELPWSDVFAVIHAVHRQHVEASTTQVDKKLSLGRAVLTGGLVNRKRVERTTSHRAEEVDHVLYVWRSSGQVPWLLRQSAVRYAPELGVRTSVEGFDKIQALLRSHAPQAHFDDRLMTRTVAQTLVASLSSTRLAVDSNEPAMDLLAHTIGLEAARRARQP